MGCTNLSCAFINTSPTIQLFSHLCRIHTYTYDSGFQDIYTIPYAYFYFLHFPGSNVKPAVHSPDSCVPWQSIYYSVYTLTTCSSSAFVQKFRIKFIFKRLPVSNTILPKLCSWYRVLQLWFHAWSGPEHALFKSHYSIIVFGSLLKTCWGS